jgi:hypothetical protein
MASITPALSFCELSMFCRNGGVALAKRVRQSMKSREVGSAM